METLTEDALKAEIERLNSIIAQHAKNEQLLLEKLKFYSNKNEMLCDDFSNEFVRYKMLSEASVEAVFILQDGICIEANDSGCKMFGYNYDEVIGLHALQVISDSFKPIVAQHINTDFLEPYEAVCKRKDGSTFYAELQGKVFTYNGRKLRVSSVRNIDKRKHAEMELFRNEQKFRTLFENAGFGIIMGNNEGFIVEVNPSFCRLLGLPSHKVINRHIRDFFDPNSLKIKPLQFDTLDRGDSLIMERDIIHSSGRVVPIEMNSRKMTTNFYISIFRDLTHQKKYEQDLLKINEELKEAKNKAEESDRLKSIFLANMSHEIRTPMNGIIGFSELLKDPDTPEEKKNDFADIVINSGTQLLQIIDDILEISRLETRQVKVNLSEINLNSLLFELFNLYSEKAKDNKLALYIKKGASDEKSNILIDITKLNKILYNLIDNAMRYTNTGFVEIGYTIDQEKVEVYVKDSGIGIHPKQINAIFERFSQGDKGLSSKFGGLGLGLSIAKENAELIGGNIHVESALGVGSTFKITFPYKPCGMDTEEQIYDYTILVVDDEEVNSLYLEILLEKYNPSIKIIMAKNGLEAIDMYNENRDIDMILMDIKMPVMDGLSATREILKLNPDVNIVAQTAYVTSEDKQKAFEAGCVDFITKPVKDKHLRAILENLEIMPKAE